MKSSVNVLKNTQVNAFYVESEDLWKQNVKPAVSQVNVVFILLITPRDTCIEYCTNCKVLTKGTGVQIGNILEKPSQLYSNYLREWK